MTFGLHGTSADVSTDAFTLRVITIGTTAYMLAPADFWSGESHQFNGGTLTPDQTAKFAAKWVQVQTAGAVYEQFSSLVGRQDFLNQVFPAQVSKIMKSPGNPIGGVPTIQLTDGKSGNLLFVSAIDGSLLLETTPQQNGTATFSDYGTAPEPSAPAASDTVDGQPLGF